MGRSLTAARYNRGMASRNDLRIGTSGWSYPTGEGTWNGIFYPPAREIPPQRQAAGKAGKFDELAYYAERFDTVEINSTFYRTPAINVTKSWAARTPKNFEFSLKLYQKFTHPKMFKEAALKRAPGHGGARAGSAGGHQSVGRRRVQARARSAGRGRQARRAARAVSAQLQGGHACARLSRTGCSTNSAIIASPSSCATAPGATTSTPRSSC